jgi:hypothetical protein
MTGYCYSILVIIFVGVLTILALSWMAYSDRE